MKNLFSIRGPVYGFLDAATQLLMVNILFIVGSLPLITIGASTIALYDGVRAITKDEFSAKRFFGNYRMHLVRGMQFEGTIIASLGLIGCIMWLVARLGFIGQCLELLCAIISALVVLSLPYLFAIASLHDLTFTVSVKTAISLCMNHMAFSIIMALVFLALMVIPIYAWRLFFIWVFFAFAACTWIDTACMRNIIDPESKSLRGSTPITPVKV